MPCSPMISTDWLNFSARAGTDFFNENRQAITRKGTRGRLNGQFETNEIYERELNTDLILSATRQLSTDITLKAIVGHNFQPAFGAPLPRFV
jgi:hypothetical protein